MNQKSVIAILGIAVVVLIGTTVYFSTINNANSPVAQTQPVAVTADSCHPTGCSNQICSDTDVVSTCEYLPKYACYKTATCARQSDGKCAWTQTPALKKCIETALKDTQIQPVTSVVAQTQGNDTPGWKTYSFESLSFKYPSQVCLDSENCKSVKVMKSGDAINIGQYLDSNEPSPSLTIYYVKNIDLKGAEKYLQGKYGTVNPISWIVEKNNADIKLADHFGGFNRISGGVLSYAAYSEKLRTLASFGHTAACLIDCDKDTEFLSSIKFDGVGVYNAN